MCEWKMKIINILFIFCTFLLGIVLGARLSEELKVAKNETTITDIKVGNIIGVSCKPGHKSIGGRCRRVFS